jgi:murein endopeptidase
MPDDGPGFRCRHHARWGTAGTVAQVQDAAAQVARYHGGDRPVVVGALSRPGGGRLRGHRSHQSGRDVDLGLISSEGPLRQFVPMHAGNLDVAASWTLLGALLERGEVIYVFLDYDLQALFYRYLEDEGVDEATLTRIFQYPAGRAARRGVIRHASGHRDHVHVRFRCRPSDGPTCQD